MEQNGYFSWIFAEEYQKWFIAGGGLNDSFPRIPAFTVAELGEMLPKGIDYQASSKENSGFDGYRTLDIIIGRTSIDNGWYVLYSDPHPANRVPVYSSHAKSEADAREKMLIYLLENKLITF